MEEQRERSNLSYMPGVCPGLIHVVEQGDAPSPFPLLSCAGF
ncbi:MAG: hypothetical protein V8R80_11535 [Eubacterium sp.]